MSKKTGTLKALADRESARILSENPQIEAVIVIPLVWDGDDKDGYGVAMDFQAGCGMPPDTAALFGIDAIMAARNHFDYIRRHAGKKQ